jgi:hypothetical protein
VGLFPAFYIPVSSCEQINTILNWLMEICTKVIILIVARALRKGKEMGVTPNCTDEKSVYYLNSDLGI